MNRWRVTAVVMIVGILCGTLFVYRTKHTPFVPHEKPLVVVIASYNNSQWYKRNLSSIFSQKYYNYRIIYTDDCSTDNTGNLVLQFAREQGQESRFTLIKNEVRQGSLANIYRAVHSCPDDAIILIVDGDDWLKHDDVFTRINQMYENPQVWLTYGQFERYPSGQRGYCCTLPANVINFNAYRRFTWLTSHLRTFYAGLFKQIKKEDLLWGDSFFPATGDMAIMFPMLEMAAGRIAFVDDILYVWNEDSDINDYKVRLKPVLYYEQVIRKRQPYDALKEATWRV